MDVAAKGAPYHSGLGESTNWLYALVREQRNAPSRIQTPTATKQTLVIPRPNAQSALGLRQLATHCRTDVDAVIAGREPEEAPVNVS